MTTTKTPAGSTETVAVAGKKTKSAASTDVLFEIATEVEGLTKTKALKEARDLADSVESSYFRLGGILGRIYENSWFDGHDSFGAFVAAEYGFQERKAKYLIEIYQNLVDKQIPWEKVSVLGWTKLKDLARILTAENVDEWVEKAKSITVFELQQLLKGTPVEKTSGSSSSNDDVTTVKYKLKPDALETVTTAIAKVKGETGTTYDNVALENLCSAFLAGTFGGTAGGDLKTLMGNAGYEKVLEIFDELFPEVDLEVSVKDGGDSGED